MFLSLLACSSTGSWDFPSVMIMATFGKPFLEPPASVKMFRRRWSMASPADKSGYSILDIVWTSQVLMSSILEPWLIDWPIFRFLDVLVPVIVFPPLYGSELMAWSKFPLLLYWVRGNSVRVSVLYWTTATRVLSSPMSKAPAREAIKLRMCLKFSLPTLHEPSTRKAKSAIALTEHSEKEKNADLGQHFFSPIRYARVFIWKSKLTNKKSEETSIKERICYFGNNILGLQKL